DGLVLVGEALNIRGNVSGVGSPADILIGGVLHAKRNVFADGFAEQECLLRNKSDVAAKIGERKVADWLGVDKDRTWCGVINARDQVHERGFAGAGRTN